MKKFTYTVAILAGLSSASIAQSLTKSALAPTMPVDAAEPAAKMHASQKLMATPFYTQDFSGGLPSGWSNTGTSDASKWEYRPDTLAIKGSRGAYSTKRIIVSPTNFNGYFIFDSDYLDNGGVAGAFGQGAAPAPHSGTLSMSPMDFSTHPSVNISFNQYFRKFAGKTLIRVSAGGLTKDYEINQTIAVNAQTLRSNTQSVNISDVAAGKSNVVISFVFDGTVKSGANSGYYFWMIDDIKLSELDANDVVLLNNSFTFGYNRYGIYTQVPKDQVGDSLYYGGAVKNDASTDLNNVKLSLKITNNGNTVTNVTSAPLSVLPHLSGTNSVVKDSIFGVTKVNLKTVGTYNFELNASSDANDANTTNNVLNLTYQTTDSVFARDRGAFRGEIGTAFTGSKEPGYRIANVYEMNAQTKASSISFYVTRGSKGAKVHGEILRRLGDNTGSSDVIEAITPDYDLQKSDSATWVTLPFFKDGKSEILKKDSTYYVAVNIVSISPTTVNVYIGDDVDITQPVSVTSIFIPQSPVGDAAWYSNGNAAGIRLNTTNKAPDAIAATENAGFQLLQNVPNPFGASTAIGYKLPKSSNVSILITDIAGREIVNINEGTQAAGLHSVNVDASNFKKGIYFYTLSAGNVKLTRKMIITE